MFPIINSVLRVIVAVFKKLRPDIFPASYASERGAAC
jgi:hypothetical protein